MKEGIVMYVFVVDLAKQLGTDKGKLFHRIKRVVPRWYAERLIELYEAARKNRSVTTP